MRVTTKGQVTIPKEIRDHLGIGPGSEVDFVEQDDLVVLQRRVADPGGRAMSFEEWVDSVSGTVDTMGMDGKEYIDWLRGPRDDLDAD